MIEEIFIASAIAMVFFLSWKVVRLLRMFIELSKDIGRNER